LNKRKMLRLFLVIALVLLVFVAGFTFAKYLTEVDGGGSGEVAKWSFVADAGNEEITDIKLKDTIQQASLLNGKIAPGTGGSFDIVVDGTGSEVSIEYSVDVTDEYNIPAGLKFGIDGEPCNYNSLSELVKERLQGQRLEYDGEQYAVRTISWLWPYEGNIDDLDTLDGEAASEYSFGLKITGIQAQQLIP